MKTILLTALSILFLFIPEAGIAQFITVTGYVNNSENGDALENVSIFESNAGIGTITNQNGFYKLLLRSSTIDLTITSDGFKDYTKQMELTGDTTLMVKLEPLQTPKQRSKKNDELHAGTGTDKKAANRRGFLFF